VTFIPLPESWEKKKPLDEELIKIYRILSTWFRKIQAFKQYPVYRWRYLLGIDGLASLVITSRVLFQNYE
jgi:hypothetical protein